jgi:hypothetical protein
VIGDERDLYGDYLDGITALRGPRCGSIDAQNLGESAWRLRRLRVAVQSYPTSDAITKDVFDSKVVAALTSWERVCGLKFELVLDTSTANIIINAARGRRNGLDGRGGILAYCELPAGNQFDGTLGLVVDSDEAWEQGTPLENVLCHEFGHGLGLSHTNTPNQLMNPFLSQTIKTPQSHDTLEIQQLYGPAVTTASPSVPPTASTPSSAGIFVPTAAKFLMVDGTGRQQVWGFKGPQLLPANAIILEGAEQW